MSTALTVPGSSTATNPRSTTPFFGRSYTLEIQPAQGPSAGQTLVVTSDEFEPNALRISFDVNQLAFKSFWFAEITIWNCDGVITSGPSAGVNLYQAVIQEGDTVTLKAGYQADGEPKVIWSGPLYYVIKDRPEVTDHRLVLNCLLSRALANNNFVNSISPALSRQYEQALQIAQESQTPFTIDSPHLAALTDQSDYAHSFFGNPQTFLTYLAEQANLLSWFDSHGIWHTDDSLNQPIGKLVATYGPASPLEGPPRNLPDGTTLSLIGQPQQIDQGVEFRVLLDNRIQIARPLPAVAVQLAAVRQTALAYPLPSITQLALATAANSRQLVQCAVIGVRFIGDTRGNPWYTEISGRFPLADSLNAIGYGQQD
jgi:hypothetical protein